MLKRKGIFFMLIINRKPPELCKCSMENYVNDFNIEQFFHSLYVVIFLMSHSHIVRSKHDNKL